MPNKFKIGVDEAGVPWIQQMALDCAATYRQVTECKVVAKLDKGTGDLRIGLEDKYWPEGELMYFSPYTGAALEFSLSAHDRKLLVESLTRLEDDSVVIKSVKGKKPAAVEVEEEVEEVDPEEVEDDDDEFEYEEVEEGEEGVEYEYEEVDDEEEEED